ncbi:hypothetical protein [Streptomyces sp. NL15-2K]|uniref:hypothetical protein n=1 Tax=Streptomyces sp. NL15-2K TaxID=376149 RepID=UPI0026EA9D3C|nr:hypothetical protein [Kutzneria buriramensis]WKX07257.1 hypothetical protein Q4V64_07060 [Kutzneria buriramensis]
MFHRAPAPAAVRGLPLLAAVGILLTGCASGAEKTASRPTGSAQAAAPSASTAAEDHRAPESPSDAGTPPEQSSTPSPREPQAVQEGNNWVLSDQGVEVRVTPQDELGAYVAISVTNDKDTSSNISATVRVRGDNGFDERYTFAFPDVPSGTEHGNSQMLADIGGTPAPEDLDIDIVAVTRS